jgi:hypothetical protein
MEKPVEADRAQSPHAVAGIFAATKWPPPNRVNGRAVEIVR